ncbi:hypothetical protein ACFV6F_17500 [Kitasatospora phosalacinea]
MQHLVQQPVRLLLHCCPQQRVQRRPLLHQQRRGFSDRSAIRVP